MRRAACIPPWPQMLAGPQLPVGLPTGQRGSARARGAAGHRLIDFAAALSAAKAIEQKQRERRRVPERVVGHYLGKCGSP
eukprot:3271400-Pyramimonas_sp.AAC.1